ncbi:hypothetical protein EMCRGX_G020228 [Ephydatia muelleri]
MAPTSKGASLYLYWILSSAAIVLTSAPVALGGGGACVELGFSSSLLCSSCDELRQFSLNALEDDCKKCCQTEGSTGVNKKYAGALIELSNTAFIKGDKSKQFNVEIKYKKGADPVLSLLDESRTVVDTLAIDKWDTDTLVEFLTERLSL